VSGGINLVVGAPGLALRVFVARGVIVFRENSRLGARVVEGIAGIPVCGLGVDRVNAERAVCLFISTSYSKFPRNVSAMRAPPVISLSPPWPSFSWSGTLPGATRPRTNGSNVARGMKCVRLV